MTEEKKKKKKLTDEEKYRRFRLVLFFSFALFLVQIVTLAIAGIIVYLLYLLGMKFGVEAFTPINIILFMVVINLAIGFLMSLLIGKFPLRPFAKIINQLNRLASGDFSARLSFSKKIANEPMFSELSDSFNKMAEELERTEMLRSDFINNFSHEFKTPIVSIAGFAKLLKRGNLTDGQRLEYADIIEKESMRLSYMATNVLNMTKVENQGILSDITHFNLSEQIRSCVLLLEDKWSAKSIDFDMEFGEYYINANEELLRQVWINIIDNAVKFSPCESTVDITLTEEKDTLCVKILNRGSEIPKEALPRIFGKFFQADQSHSSEGNGLGLAIVSKIVELHSGEAYAESNDMTTAFYIRLPK